MTIASKQGHKEPKKPSSLKLKKFKPLLLKTLECAMKPSDMASLSNSKWQNRKKRRNRRKRKTPREEVSL